jgi:hypothetical protein
MDVSPVKLEELSFLIDSEKCEGKDTYIVFRRKGLGKVPFAATFC